MMCFLAHCTNRMGQISCKHEVACAQRDLLRVSSLARVFTALC